MICTYETEMACKCPVDGSTDRYVVIIESLHMIQVEAIIDEIRKFADRIAFQEDVTEALAGRFACRVTTTGVHSGVKTKVSAE